MSAFVRDSRPKKGDSGSCFRQSPSRLIGLGKRCRGFANKGMVLSLPSRPCNSMMLLSFDPDVDIQNAVANVAGSGTALTFDPILNVPALFTFLFITVVFTTLIVRTNQVEEAVQDRKTKLQALRAIKSKELAGDVTVTTDQVDDMLRQYEEAVRREETLRNILPGGTVRIVPPSASDATEEEASQIAKQFLGQDYDIGVPKRLPTERRGVVTTMLPIAILATLILSQFGLFALLTLDPMGATSWIESL